MNSIPITRALRKFTAEIDAVVEKNNAKRTEKELKVTCSKGCSDCCSLLALSLNVEGLNIAEYLLSDERSLLILPSLLESLLANAKEADYPGMTHASFFDKDLPCPFLKDKQCSVYDRRPASCRYHFSVSDPAKCSPKHPTGEIMRLDILWAEDAVSEWNYSATKDPTPSPISISVIWALHLLVTANSLKTKFPNVKPELVSRITEIAEQVATPHEWVVKNAQGLLKEETFRPATEEEIDEEGRRDPN